MNTDSIEITPYSTDLTTWIPWDIPELEGGIEEPFSIVGSSEIIQFIQVSFDR